MGCTPEQCAKCDQKKVPEGCSEEERATCDCQDNKQKDSE